MQNFKVRFFLTIVVLTFNMCVFGQNNQEKKIDSLSHLIINMYAKGNFNQYVILKNTTELYYLSKENKNVDAQLLSLFEEAKVYFINGSLDIALSKISEGIDLAKSEKKYNFLCRFLLIHQRLLLELDHLQASKDILSKAMEYNSLIDSKEDRATNNVYILLAKADILAINDAKKDKNQIIALKKQAYTHAQNLNNSNILKTITLIFSSESFSLSLISYGMTGEAKKYSKVIDDILTRYPSDALRFQNLMIKGKIANADKEYAAAIEFYTQAAAVAKKNKNYFKLYEAYPLISESYNGLKDYEKSSFYSKSYKNLVDSINIVKKNSGDVALLNSINAKILSPEDNKNTVKYIIISVLIVLLGAIAFIFYRKKTKNNEINRVEAHEKRNVSDDNPNELNDDSTVTKKLVELAKDDINTFYVEFRKVYPTFYKTLQEKYPELNISDINFCSLIKMNFGIKEIAQFTKSSVRAVEARKYRINKKMQLKNQNELFIILSMIN